MEDEELVLQGQLLVIIALLQKKRSLLERKPYKKKEILGQEDFTGTKKIGAVSYFGAGAQNS